MLRYSRVVRGYLVLPLIQGHGLSFETPLFPFYSCQKSRDVTIVLMRNKLYTPEKHYRNVFIIFSLHTEMDENRCTNGIIRVANYTTFVHRFSSISVCNEKIMKTFLII